MSDLRPASGFRQRLAYYLIGLAIGFLMLGVLWSMKSKLAASQPTPASPQSTAPKPYP